MYETSTEFGDRTIYPFIDSKEELRQQSGVSWRLTVDSEGIIRDGNNSFSEEESLRMAMGYLRAIEVSRERKK